MADIELQIEEFKTTKGDTRYNLNLKKKEGKVGGLEVDQSVVIEKTFQEGIEKQGNYTKPYYIVQAKYAGKDVGFFLNQEEHNIFKSVGGVGSKVRITLKLVKIEYTLKDKKMTRYVERLTTTLA